MPCGTGEQNTAVTEPHTGHKPVEAGQLPDNDIATSPKTPHTSPAPAQAARLSRSPSLDEACRRPEWPGELGPGLESSRRRWRSTEDVLSPTAARGSQAFRVVSPLHSLDAAHMPSASHR